MTSKAHADGNGAASPHLSAPPTVQSAASPPSRRSLGTPFIGNPRPDPASLAPREVLRLQSVIGNHAVGRLLSTKPAPPPQAHPLNIARRGPMVQRKVVEADELVENAAYYFVHAGVFYKANFLGFNEDNLTFVTDKQETIYLPGRIGKKWAEEKESLPKFHDNPDELRRPALLGTMLRIRGETIHSGETPELNSEKKELYKAVRAGSLQGVKKALSGTRISCREGAFILSLLASYKKDVVEAIITRLLDEGSGNVSIGGAPLEEFLWKQMEKEPYTGSPQVGALIHILGTTHTVLYVGEGEVVSLNNNERFQVRKLSDEINSLLASPPEDVREMLKIWRGSHPGSDEVLGALAEEFDEYVYGDEPSAQRNNDYIGTLKLKSPERCCSVSESLAAQLF